MHRKTTGLLIAILAVIAISFATTASTFGEPPGKRCGNPASAHNAESVRSERSSSLDVLYYMDSTIYIPDNPGDNTNDTAVSVLPIPNDIEITDLNVRIVISHSWVRDLYISLTGPQDTTEVVLVNLLPQDDADTLDGWFDDEAGISILDTVAPLIGIWRPMDELSVFDGQSAQGEWTLRVWDRFHLDSGYVAGWGVDVNPINSLTGTATNGFTRTPVRNARVDVQGVSWFGRTDSRGEYAILSLPSGVHTVLFSKAQYETLSVADVVIEDGQTTQLDVTMQTEAGFYEYASRSEAVQIPDSGGGPSSMSLSVRATEAVTVLSLDVTVNISHTYVSDLALYLISPAQDTVLLANRVGGSGENFVDCRFSDDSDSLISNYAAPFTGRFRPQEPLNEVDSISMTGSWELMGVDLALLDTGTIENFTLHVTGAPLSVSPSQPRALPEQVVFHGNYPNPFNAVTEFRFDMTKPARVSLTLFDVLGRRAAVVTDEFYSAGSQRIFFDAKGLPSGIYFARLSAEGASQSCKIVLLK